MAIRKNIEGCNEGSSIMSDSGGVDRDDRERGPAATECPVTRMREVMAGIKRTGDGARDKASESALLVYCGQRGDRD